MRLLLMKKKKKFLRLKTRYAFSVKQLNDLYKIKKKPYIKANVFVR